MAPLSPASLQALARLRAYRPPPTCYSTLPLSRRAAVLILLFAGRRGELKVVLTMRANTLSSYPGQVAFPGGKADTPQETPFQTARREALEEIGLPLDDARLPPQFRIEHLCELPTNFARTELAVRPCVAYLHSATDTAQTDNSGDASAGDVEESLIPRLDAREVAAVFTASFHDYLLQDVTPTGDGKARRWYEGIWVHWHGTSWRMHSFYVPVGEGQTRVVASGRGAQAEPYRVFGMTARILVDAARVAYDDEPAFEHNAHFGDEELLLRLRDEGRLGAVEKKQRTAAEGAKGAKM